MAATRVQWIPSGSTETPEPQLPPGFAPIPLERGTMTTRPSKRYPNQPLTAKKRSLRHDTMESRLGSVSYRPRPLRIYSSSTSSSAYNSPPLKQSPQTQQKYQPYRPHQGHQKSYSLPPQIPYPAFSHDDEPASDMIRAIDRVLLRTSTITSQSPSSYNSPHSRNRSISVQIAHSNTPLMSPVIGTGMNAERLAAPLPSEAEKKRSEEREREQEHVVMQNGLGGVWGRRDRRPNVAPLTIDTNTAQAKRKPNGHFILLQQPSKLGPSHYGSGKPAKEQQQQQRPNTSDEPSRTKEEIIFRPLDQRPLHKLPIRKPVPRPAQQEEYQRPRTAPETVSIPSTIPESAYSPTIPESPPSLPYPKFDTDAPIIDIISPVSSITTTGLTYNLPNNHYLSRSNTDASRYSNNSDASSSYEDFLPNDIGSIYSLDINRDSLTPSSLRITNYDDCVDDLYTVLEDFGLTVTEDFANLQKAALTRTNTLTSRRSTRRLSRTPTTRSRLARTASTASRNTCAIKPTCVELTQWDVDSNKEVTSGPITTSTREYKPTPTPVFSCRIGTVGEVEFPEFWVDDAADVDVEDSDPPTPELEASLTPGMPETWFCSRVSSQVLSVRDSIEIWPGVPQLSMLTKEGVRREWMGSKVGNLGIPQSPTLSIVPDKHFSVRSLTPDRMGGKKKHKLLGFKKRWRSK